MQAEGFDIAAVEEWVGKNIEELTPPFDWQRLEGGHSNLTYKLTDETGQEAVVRRPPQGELLPKAHDMSREWALISSLGPRPQLLYSLRVSEVRRTRGRRGSNNSLFPVQLKDVANLRRYDVGGAVVILSDHKTSFQGPAHLAFPQERLFRAFE